jgi:hypothetical protein
MKHIGIAGFSLITAIMLSGLAASPSFALPDGSLTLSVSSFPLRLNFESATTKGTLETTAGGLLTGEGGKISLSISQLTSLGTARLTFEKIADGAKKCSSTGDTAGTILVEGTGHLVYTSLSPNLQLGILYEPKTFEIECEGTDVEVKGDAIASLNGIGTETTELTSASGKLSGNKGVQEIKEYYNDGGTKVKTQLLTNPGNGFKESDLVVEGEPVLKALGSNMFVITGR